MARQDPEKFLNDFNTTGVGIDECQLEPDLFFALKEKVRIKKVPGQFLLSGSIRFTSKKAIQESLTGRIVNYELYPFTISEIQHKSLPKTCHKILNTAQLSNLERDLQFELKQRRNLENEIEIYKERGGLPSVCFLRDNKIRRERIEEQLRTILDRDIHEIYSTTLSSFQIRDFLSHLAQIQGEIVNFEKIKRETGLSDITQKKLLYALEAVFLIRRIPVDGANKKFICYFEDQAESSYLAPDRDASSQFEELIFRHVRAEFGYQIGESYRVFHYLTRNRARVPLAIAHESGTLGIVPINSGLPERIHLASASSFLRRYINSKVVFVTRGQDITFPGPRLISVPAAMII